MPSYDLCLVMRQLPRTGLVESLKRTCLQVLDSGGVIRSMESLGDRQIPQRTRQHGQWHTHGHYFIVRCDLPFKTLPVMLEEFRRDKDILRKGFLALDRTEKKEPPVCTLEDELKPPSFRPSVQDMIKEGRRAPRFKHIWNPKTGLDYYPFHR